MDRQSPGSAEAARVGERPGGSSRTLRARLDGLLPQSVGTTLTILLLIVMLPGLLFQAGEFYDRVLTQRTEALEQDLSLARMAEALFTTFIDDIANQELAIGTALASSSMLPLSAEEANRYLATSGRGRARQSVSYFFWADPHGRIVASGLPASVGLDVGGEPYFQSLARGQERAVSDLTRSQAFGVDPAFFVARAIRNGEGALQGVVVAVVAPDSLGDVLAAARTSAGTLSVIDHQGRLVFSYPDRQLTWEERDLVGRVPGVEEALERREVSGRGRDIGGEASLFAAIPAQPSGWLVRASRPEAQTMAPALASVARDLSLLLLVAAAGFATALLVGRHITVPLARLHAQATTWRRGALGERADVGGPGEIRDLAHALNAMVEELRVREEQRDAYVRAVSHDLRHPLTIIQGQAQMLWRSLQKDTYDGPRLRTVEAILASSRSMNAMIQDLVDAARLEGGQVRLNLTSVEMGAFVLDLKARLAGTFEAERIAVEAPEGICPVRADPERLERILMNLLSNAFKYSPPDTPITVRIEQQGGEVITAVSDRGAGIPAEELPRLFQQYYRTTATRARPESLGLGLHICRGFVEAPGGRIWVDSELGKGSTFYFSLPCA